MGIMNPYMTKGAAASARAIEQIAAQLAGPTWDERRDPDRFTPREVLAHLADWEPILRARIEGALKTPDFVITPYDETQRAEDGAYSSKDPQASLRLFLAERARTVALLATLTDEQLALTAIHPENGPMTVSDLAGFFLGHDAYHIDQLLEYLAEPKTVGTW